MVGFSLEDKDHLKRGREKLNSKKLDLIVLNSDDAIGSDEIDARILKKSGKIIKIGRVDKWQLANKILDECITEMTAKK
jgi:phosphopantothenoylcysteine synthetase/decarboxylase